MGRADYLDTLPRLQKDFIFENPVPLKKIMIKIRAYTTEAAKSTEFIWLLK